MSASLVSASVSIAVMAVVLMGLTATVHGHVCFYRPIGRPDKDGSIISDAEWALYNNTVGPLARCRRNINVSPFENADSAQYGSVCGGNSNHPYLNGNNAWNTPVTTLAAENIISAGSTYSIWILLNVAHPDTSNARSSYIYVDMAATSTPSQFSDFSPIAVIPLEPNSTIPNQHIRYDWQVPATWNVPRGVLRISYLTALTAAGGLVPHPAASGISNVYTSCADISLNGITINASAPASPSLCVLFLFLILVVSLFS
eukprot:ANDGO_06125.mRNA.1 hypothetical protein